ncbi:MAG: hypothetical protein K6F21_07070 [Bacteroidales bacterium]|nr:hypothetical protein [Bacteroidales bacterium]
MTNYYKVAGHVFGVEIPDANPLCSQISQYEPFTCPAVDSPVFSLVLADSVNDEGKSLVYSGSEESGEPVIRLYSLPDGWISEVAICPGRPISSRLYMSKDFSAGRLQILRPSESLFALNNALMLMFAFRTAGMSTLEMHASVIVNGGRAYLWLATSGTGKSTHSSLWLKHVPGSHLLNDDNPIVRVMEDGHVEVFGSPWSGKTPCYRNEHYPAGAFTRIRRADHNAISRLNNFEAYALIYSSSSGFKFDPHMGDDLHATFEKVVGASPCFVLDCLPDADAARVSSGTLLKMYE